METFFLTLIPLKDATAQTLCNSVAKFFTENNMPYEDGANSILGALLKAAVPHLFIMKCICHSFALCASNVCHNFLDQLKI